MSTRTTPRPRVLFSRRVYLFFKGDMVEIDISVAIGNPWAGRDDLGSLGWSICGGRGLTLALRLTG
jgi:hypothetical protein